MLLLGSHLSIAGGWHNALLTAKKLGCNCLQIFVKNQRQWRMSPVNPQAMELWARTRAEVDTKISRVVAHSGYLINLSSDSSQIRQWSIQSLNEELSLCDALGRDRLVLHPGSHRGQGVAKGIELVVKGLDTVLGDNPGVKILLETTSGAGNCLGGKIEEIAQIRSASRYAERV